MPLNVMPAGHAASLREDGGLTVKEAAALVSVTPSTWYQWESGKKAMPQRMHALFAARKEIGRLNQQLARTGQELQAAQTRIKQLESQLAGRRDLT